MSLNIPQLPLFPYPFSCPRRRNSACSSPEGPLTTGMALLALQEVRAGGPRVVQGGSILLWELREWGWEGSMGTWRGAVGTGEQWECPRGAVADPMGSGGVSGRLGRSRRISMGAKGMLLGLRDSQGG